MSIAIFNPLEYVHKLEEAGMERHLAEVQAQIHFEAFQRLADDHSVTKEDIKNIRHDIKELKRDMIEMYKELKTDTNLLRKQLTIRMGYMLTGLLFTLVTLLKLFNL